MIISILPDFRDSVKHLASACITRNLKSKCYVGVKERHSDQILMVIMGSVTALFIYLFFSNSRLHANLLSHSLLQFTHKNSNIYALDFKTNPKTYA